MLSASNILLGLLLSLVSYALYKHFLYPFVLFLQISFKIGFNKVSLNYDPFRTMVNQPDTQKYSHSFGKFLNTVKNNPDIKVIVCGNITGISYIVCDSQMIRKINYDYNKYVEKRVISIFSNEMRKGLFFQRGDEWKQSRSIISNLFHFDKLKSREDLMNKVIKQKIANLNENGGNPNLLVLGSSIGGQIVIKSLFGEQYFEIKFGKNNPYEQIKDLMKVIGEETLSLGNIIKIVFFNKTLNSNSWFLTQSQKELIKRMHNFQNISKQFLIKERERFLKGQTVSPFIEAYLTKKSDDTYIEELIHQLFFFMFAAEDTTGSLIENSLALLAEYPQYQQIILKDIEQTSIHSSKEINNFINEVARLHSAISFSFPRQTMKEFQIDGVRFQKGREIILLIGGPMNNPKYWDNVVEFDPKRFNHSIQNPISFIPFLSGPRNCIGQHMALMQVRIVIYEILKHYKLQKVGNSLATKAKTIINNLIDSHYVRFVEK